MADPTQLQGQIYQSYGKGVTCYQPEQVQEALRRDQNIRQENLKSLYDVTADLDAAAMSSIQSELDDIYKKIDSNELNLRSPQFAAAQSKLNSTAVGLKEVQNMAQQVLADAAKNPENVSYIVTDEYGRPKDLGYQGLVEAMTNFSSGQYGRPEEYIGAGSAALSGVDTQVDENELQRDIRKSVDADLENWLKSQKLSDAEIESRMGEFRTGKMQLSFELPPDIRQTMAKNASQRFRNGLISQFAVENARIGVDQSKSPERWGEDYVLGMIPEGISTTETIKKDKPQTLSASERKYFRGLEREVEAAKDLKQDVYNAQQSLDPSYIMKYLDAFGYTAKKQEDGKFQFYQPKMSSTGKISKNNIRIVDPNDAESLYDLIADINENISREAIDQIPFDAPQGEETRAAKEQRTEVDKTFENLQDDEKKQESVEYFNSIDGVEFIEGSFGSDDKLVIDGVEYNLTDDAAADEANLKIKAKLRGVSSTKKDLP